MNPAGKPADSVQWQGMYEGYSAQPGVTTMVQHTTVDISAEPPKDYVVWSLFNFVHLNPCCLGLVALIFSIKARDRWMVRDLNGARSYASTARCLNIFATALISILILVFIIFLITYMKMLHLVLQNHDNNPYNRGHK